MDTAVADQLRAIRNRIDAIDEQVHGLLIDRSRVIDELIRMKGVSKPGGAFRPDREADMMRRLVMRHDGHLPLATIEHIWREIITTFTAMQAPFGVLVGAAADDLALRDLVRFYFGFSVPVKTCESNKAAIARIAADEGDIAVVPIGSEERWWAGLAAPDGPRIFARIPFIEIAGRPASLPAYVIGPPLKEPPVADTIVYSGRQTPATEAAITAHDGTIVGRADGEMVFELPASASLEDIARHAAERSDARPIGTFSQPIRHIASRSA